MADHPSSHWALKIAATAGSDLDVAGKLALETYEKTNLLHPGLVARVSHVEILNRETGQSGTYAFVGVGVGFGAGILSADLADKWHPFDTTAPITLSEFGSHSATLYNMSAGLGFNWAPISGIRFEGIDIHHDSKWDALWHGNGISIGGPSTLNAGTSLDVSEVGGRLFTIHHDEGNQSVIEHLDEINQICVVHGLGETPMSITPADVTTLHVVDIAPHAIEPAGGLADPPGVGISEATYGVDPAMQSGLPSSDSGRFATHIDASPTHGLDSSVVDHASDTDAATGHHAAAHPTSGVDSTPVDANYNDPSGHATHVDASPTHGLDSSVVDHASDTDTATGHHAAAHPTSGVDSTPVDANYNDPSGHATHVNASPGHEANHVTDTGPTAGAASIPDIHGPAGMSHP
jgi:hypothetical protein